MSYAPGTLLGLRAYLQPLTGLSNTELGLVGDATHDYGYHLGRDRLGSGDYSAATARDRAGMSEAASALDIGEFPRLRELSMWLVTQCRAGAADCADIREVIYTADGETVLRWDAQRGIGSAPQPGEADDSHLWHAHISWYRDSEQRDKTAVFRRFFEGGDMPFAASAQEDPHGTALIWRVGGIQSMLDTINNHVNNPAEPNELARFLRAMAADIAALKARPAVAVTLSGEQLGQLAEAVAARIGRPASPQEIADAVLDEDHARTAQ